MLKTILLIFWASWHIAGVIGYILYYCSNKNIRSKKAISLLFSFCTHFLLGYVGLIYGGIIFGARKSMRCDGKEKIVETV